VFDRTLEDQKVVASLQQLFNQLQRGVYGGSAMINGYRYQLAFIEDGVALQVYSGATCHNVWLVQENSARNIIPHPYAILNSLHKSMGLPVWISPTRRPQPARSDPWPLQPLTAQEVLERLDRYRK